MSLSTLLLIYVLHLVFIDAREVVNINHSWRFSKLSEGSNENVEVHIPHMYNLDALIGTASYYRGPTLYTKNITIPASYKGKVVHILFKGVGIVARLTVNQNFVGEHRGAYTHFSFDISEKLNYGAVNTFNVEVNNKNTGDIMPLSGDFTMYGGIYRDVELIVTEKNHISLLDYASSGVYIKQTQVSSSSAHIDTKVILRGEGSRVISCIVNMTDASGDYVVSGRQDVQLDPNGNGVSLISFDVINPHLWNGRKDPYMYQVKVTTSVDAVVTDVVNQRIGLRYYRIDKEEGFFLNGNYMKLHGVSRHQERAELGNALHPVHHEEDIKIMLEMGVNSIRLAHYPHNHHYLDLIDEAGILSWSEIPFVDNFAESQSFRNNGKQQLIEMIRQSFNRPSIIVWGLWNEVGNAADQRNNYIRELNDLVHKEDPTRPTIAGSAVEKLEMDSITDYIGYNKYFGWYGGKPEDFANYFDSYHKSSGLPWCISEYGAGSSIYHQQEELKQPAHVSYWHPENWATHVHEVVWKIIAERKFVWATFVWNMFDFGMATRREGDQDGKNDKGLVTWNRKIRKDVYYFYKANWNEDDKFVYISNTRLRERFNATQNIKVYSNLKTVEVIFNSKSLGTIENKYGTFEWTGVKAQLGKNTIIARSGDFTDESSFNLLTDSFH